MTPAPAKVASAPTTGDALTREIIRAQAALKDKADPAIWGRGFNEGAASFTTSSPMVMMGNAKAASQTYNAGALFTNNATAIPKG